MKRSPELEVLLSADESAIRDSNPGRGRLLRAAALLLGGVAAAYFLFMGDKGPAGHGLGGDEEFRTSELLPSSFERKAPEPAALVELPELPPPPVPKVLPPPSPPVETFPGRFRSGLIVMDESKDAEGADGDADGGVAGSDRNSQFLAAASALKKRSAAAAKLKRIDALVPEGTMIPGILETAINSDLPGQVRAIVSSDVYSFDGRRVLIPTGSRLIGEYQADIQRGQKRVFVVWTRLIREDGVSVSLNSIGADGMGRAGMTGHVDTKFMERFSSAMLLSVMSGVASYVAAADLEAKLEINTRSGTAKLGDGNRKAASESIAESLTKIAEQEFGANLSIPPTISIPQGENLFVYVRQDLDFSALYDDPVTEAMKEIKRERGLH